MKANKVEKHKSREYIVHGLKYKGANV